MTEEERAEYLASYDDWREPQPAGWHSMRDLPLRAREVELLFDDGHTEDWPVSNAQFLIMPQRPLAWRNALSTKDIFRKRIIAWASAADEAGLWAVLRAIQRHERKETE
jgi:hypothetical protein